MSCRYGTGAMDRHAVKTGADTPLLHSASGDSTREGELIHMDVNRAELN
jgi:hypothetical protein